MSWFRRNTKRADRFTAEVLRERKAAQDMFDADMKSARESVTAEHDAKYREIPSALSTVECPKCLSECLDRAFVPEVSLSSRSVRQTVIRNVVWTCGGGAVEPPGPVTRTHLVRSESVELLRLTCVSCQHVVGWEKPADAQG